MRCWSSETGLKFGAIGLAALLSGGWVLAALGAGQGTGSHWGVAGRYRTALKRLRLSPTQEDAIRGLIAAEKPALATLQDQRRESRAALKAILQADQPDPAAVGTAILKVRADRRALRAELMKVHDATVAQLTPDQKVRFDAYLDAFRMMRHRHTDFS